MPHSIAGVGPVLIFVPIEVPRVVGSNDPCYLTDIRSEDARQVILKLDLISIRFTVYIPSAPFRVIRHVEKVGPELL